MLFTSCLCPSRVLEQEDSFLLLPRGTLIWVRLPGSSGIRTVTRPGVSMDSTGDPSGDSRLTPSGPVTAPRKRGAGRNGALATHDICGALSDLYHVRYRSRFRLAVLLTGSRRRHGGGGAGLLCGVVPPAEVPADGGRRLPHLRRLLVARSPLARHHRLSDGSRRPQGGAGPPGCTGTRHRRARGGC